MNHRVETASGQVIQFVTSPEAYMIYVEPNLRLDVARCQNLPVAGTGESYLWVQALQGFFVLHQRLPGPWELIYELVPEEFSLAFFPWIEEHFFELLPVWPVREGSLDPLGMTPDGE